jgi:hypothetical protein
MLRAPPIKYVNVGLHQAKHLRDDCQTTTFEMLTARFNDIKTEFMWNEKEEIRGMPYVIPPHINHVASKAVKL